MKDLSCKFCGGGKFVRFPTWMECWYCGSEFELPKRETTQVLIQESRLFPYNFGATYFIPSGSYSSEPYRQRRYDYKLEQWVDE